MSYYKKTLLAALAALAITSCTKYNITGSSDMQGLDGRMVFLKTTADDKVLSLDSCDVIHGKFRFSGNLDSTHVVTLCMGDTPLMPVVLEDGDISIVMNGQRQECTGTPLNDTLSAFNERYQKLVFELDDLAHQQSQAIMNGENMDIVNKRLDAKAQRIIAEEDQLISRFISENFDNCLGPYVFQMATSGYEYPVLVPWIEALMAKATDAFKNDRYVKEYMQAAQHNQDIMTGVIDPATPSTQQTPFNHQRPLPPPPPTPNEMAKGAE
jgi:hypothetical protein